MHEFDYQGIGHGIISFLLILRSQFFLFAIHFFMRPIKRKEKRWFIHSISQINNRFTAFNLFFFYIWRILINMLRAHLFNFWFDFESQRHALTIVVKCERLVSFVVVWISDWRHLKASWTMSFFNFLFMISSCRFLIILSFYYTFQSFDRTIPISVPAFYYFLSVFFRFIITEVKLSRLLRGIELTYAVLFSPS